MNLLEVYIAHMNELELHLFTLVVYQFCPVYVQAQFILYPYAADIIRRAQTLTGNAKLAILEEKVRRYDLFYPNRLMLPFMKIKAWDEIQYRLFGLQA